LRYEVVMAAAGLHLALAGPAQIDHVGNTQLVDRGEIVCAGIAVLRRAPQQPLLDLPPGRRLIAAVISEIVYTFERDNAGLGHALRLAA